MFTKLPYIEGNAMSNQVLVEKPVYLPKKEFVMKWNVVAPEFDLAFKNSAMFEKENHTIAFQTWVGEYQKTFEKMLEQAPLQEVRKRMIPLDLVPETAAVSVIGAISLIGFLVTLAISGGISTLFVAPLLASAVGFLFLWQAIRRHS